MPLILKNLSKKAKVFLILLVVSLASLLYLYATTRPKTPEPIFVPPPSVSPINNQQFSSNVSFSKTRYYLRLATTQPTLPPSFLYWFPPYPVYATQNKVFKVDDNSLLFSLPPTAKFYPVDRPLAIYYTIGSKFFTYDLIAKKSTEISDPKNTGLSSATITSSHLTIYSPDRQILQDVRLGNFTKSSIFTWKNDQSLILIEKVSQPQEVDYVYEITTSSPTKNQLTDSFPIPSRINTQIAPAVSPDGDLLLLDNQNRFWIVTPKKPSPRIESVDLSD